MGIINTIREEINTVFERDPAAKSKIEILLCYPGLHAMIFYRAAHWLWVRRLFLMGRVLSHLGRFLTGIETTPRRNHRQAVLH